jgi:NADH-quinone oxidoreductase subunit L
MLFAAEAAADPAAGWFLTHAWLIPLIPAIGFAFVLLLGKRTGRATSNGAYFGIGSMLASLALSVGCVVQWISRVGGGGGSSEGAFGRIVSGIGRSVVVRAASADAGGEGGHTYVAPVIKTFTWWQNGGVKFGIGSHVDGLSVMAIFVVALISTLIQIYSLEYVRGDRRYTHFFASLTLFSAGMLAMVLAENTVQLLLGWEIMGLCSFMLIGHWWEESANNVAALKAFWTVRVGDVGLLIGISMLFFGAGSFSIDRINAWALENTTSTRLLFWTAIALLAAVIGKSGQFPLHTWLPDAMAGPTPVSALLHSSTMVVAGVYLAARLYPVFYVGFHIADGGVNPLALIGGITILISGLLALVQDDIKKVLAYSTVGQLGYMVMGLGVGAWTPAVFHIFTHAWFKACLFLGAGSVSHSASHHSFDMKKDMGGLWRKMPWTFGTFFVSTLALTGVPLLAGFFSKDEIIDNAGHNGYVTFQVIGLIGAFFTAAYMARVLYLTFFGQPRGASAGVHHDEHDTHDAHALVAAGAGAMLETQTGFDAAHGFAAVHDHAAAVHDTSHDAGHGAHDVHGHDDAHAGPHESPWLITGPLVVLAVGAVAAGYLNAAPFKIEKFTEWVQPGLGALTFPTLDHAPFEWVKALPSIGLVALGLVGGFFVCKAMYEKALLRGLTRRNPLARGLYTFVLNKYHLDDLYEKVIVRGVAGPIARAAYWVNQNVLDRIVDTVGLGAVGLGRFVYKWFDQRGIDGLVNGSGATARGAGGALRGTQSGKVQQYGALLFGAATLAALAFVIFVQAK